jgi:hypothetical protein
VAPGHLPHAGRAPRRQVVELRQRAEHHRRACEAEAGQQWVRVRARAGADACPDGCVLVISVAS